MALSLRQARKSDAAEIALLVNIAVHGNMARGWAQDEEAKGTYEPLEVGRLEMLKDDAFGWRNATMAENDGEIAGMLLGYRKPDAKQAVPDNIWAPLRPIQELEEEANGRFFISMLGTHKRWRGKGVGSLLLDHADERAAETEANGQALIVEDANEGARKLYERRGFSVMQSRPMVPFPGVTPHGSDWLLMVKE